MFVAAGGLESTTPMPHTSADSAVDLDRLLKLRVIVARVGEMDLAQWWNTKSQLGPLGTASLRRGFPRTHRFAAARAVFAVAAYRCDEIFNPPMCVNLWKLSEWIESEFDERWEQWLDDAGNWREFFGRVESITSPDLVKALETFGLVDAGDIDRFTRLRRSAESRAVQLPGAFEGLNADISLLALGFARGERGALAVPYMRREDA